MNLLKRAFISSDRVCIRRVMQYENKTHMSGKFQKYRGKEKILKAFVKNTIFYKGTKTKTKQISEVLAKFYVRR